MNANTAVTHRPGPSHWVLDSPHSGVTYPADFDFACDLATLRRAEDTHVEKLYAFATQLGASWIEAHFPRSYLDANRDTTEIDPALLASPWPGSISDSAKVKLGKGLIWRLTDEGLPIYQRFLSVQEVQNRITQCWVPYHAAVESAINAAHAAHGRVIHINCHSMPSVAAAAATQFPGEAHPDFVLGNRDHSTSSPELLEKIRATLAAKGYSVALNHPYKGVELVRRYSKPAQNRHSIQVEINRALYMNEQTLEIHDGFAKLQADLQDMLAELA
jgi:N-formylglutamate deformylase